MKKQIEIELGRVQFWRGEAPGPAYSAARILERRVLARSVRDTTASAVVGIEIWMPMGARALYGLLGVHFEGAGSERCAVRVPVVQGTEGPRFTDAIAPSYDEVRVGLPEEYGHEVAHWLAFGVETLGVGCGTLTVERAAHSLVGSSPSIFSALAVLIVRMLVERFDEEPPEVIGEILRDTLTRSANNLLGEMERPG
jgi:hypothetical protein